MHLSAKYLRSIDYHMPTVCGGVIIAITILTLPAAFIHEVYNADGATLLEVRTLIYASLISMWYDICIYKHL